MQDIAIVNNARTYIDKFTTAQQEKLRLNLVQHIRDGHRFALYPDKKNHPEIFLTARFATVGETRTELYLNAGNVEVLFDKFRADCTLSLYQVAYNTIMQMLANWDLTEKVYWCKVQRELGMDR